jgi:hypothetical protein
MGEILGRPDWWHERCSPWYISVVYIAEVTYGSVGQALHERP